MTGHAGVDLSVVHPLDPAAAVAGGFDTFVAAVLAEVDPGCRVEVLGATADPARRPVGVRQVLEVRGRKLAFLPVTTLAGRAPLSLRFVLGCWRLGARPEGRVVHFHRFESTFAPRARRARRQVLFSHNHPVELSGARGGNGWRRLAGLHRRLFLARAAALDQVWCVDPRTPGWLRRRLGGARCRPQVDAVPLWVPEEFAGSSRAKGGAWRSRLGVEPGARLVVFAARLADQKDPLLALEAFERASARCPDLRLVVAGEGPLGARLDQRLARSPAAGRVHRVGALERAEVASLLRAARALVVSSHYESGPFTVLEALACGTPVASFPVGQAEALLSGEAAPGVLARPRTPEALAEAMLEVVSWPPGAALSQRCRSRVEGRTARAALYEVLSGDQQVLGGAGGEEGLSRWRDRI